MGYLERLGLGKASYDRHPIVAVEGYAEACWSGWAAVTERLREAVAGRDGARHILAVECYAGILDAEVAPALQEALRPDLWIATTAEAFKPVEAIEELVAPDLGGEDPIFGRFTRLTMVDFLDPRRV